MIEIIVVKEIYNYNEFGLGRDFPFNLDGLHVNLTYLFYLFRVITLVIACYYFILSKHY